MGDVYREGIQWVSDFPTRFKELIGDTPYRQIGPELGISPSTVSAYILGKRSPKTPVLGSIARHFNVHPVWLMGADVPKYNETPADEGEGLNEDRAYLTNRIKSLSDDEVRILRGIIDQVLSMRNPEQV